MKYILKQEYWPDHIIIIGAGRWARIITKEICNNTPSFIDLSIHSRNHIDSMVDLVKDFSPSRKIHLYSGWPPPTIQAKKIAAIIVNAAKDHPEAVKWALANCSSVLVEKPIAPSHHIAQDLIDIAHNYNSLLAPAHVFLFAKYLENFKKFFPKKRFINSISFDWTDPAAETRYGEKKHYDPRVSIYADWLPHIIPIIEMITGKLPESCHDIQINRGGAAIKIELKMQNISCYIRMERNAHQRQRIIKVIADDQKYELDFSIEPGVIRHAETIINADDQWNIDDRPLAKMLKTFLCWRKESLFDKRLDLNPAVQTCYIINEVQKKYWPELNRWAYLKLLSDKQSNQDLCYALTEILMNENSFSTKELDHYITLIKSYFTKLNKSTYNDLTNNNENFELMHIIKKLLPNFKPSLF